MLLQPVARGSRRCSEKKKWEDASRVEINNSQAQQAADLTENLRLPAAFAVT